MKKDENINIEYKREFIDDIKNEIIAFLNTSGGKIYVGINDDKTTYKSFDAIERDQIDLKIGNWMEDAIYPSTFGLVKHSFDDNGILIIQVLEGTNKPYYLKEKGPKPSGVYKRVGSSKRKATEEEILKMILDSKRYVYENDISEEQNLTFKYLTNVFDEKKISFTDREQISLGRSALYAMLHRLTSRKTQTSPSVRWITSDSLHWVLPTTACVEVDRLLQL